MFEKSCELCDKYKTCRDCFPLAGRAITFPSGSENAEIMVIGQAPSLKEYLPSPRNCLEHSQSAKLLLECLSAREVGIEMKNLYFTNLVKCSSFIARTRGGGEHNGEGFRAKCYKRFLKAEIDQLSPKRIVVLGDRSWDFLVKNGQIDTRFHKVTHPAYFLGGRAKSRDRKDYLAELKREFQL